MMGGWKTWTAAALTILGGAVAASRNVFPEYAAAIDMGWQIIIGIAGAFGVVGIGHKVEKLAASSCSCK